MPMPLFFYMFAELACLLASSAIPGLAELKKNPFKRARNIDL